MKSFGTFLRLYDRTSLRYLAVAVAISAVISLADLAALTFLYSVFGQILGGGISSTAVSLPFTASPTVLVAAAVALMAGRSIASFVVRYWWGLKAASAEVGLSRRLLDQYAFAPYDMHLRVNSSELMTKAVANVNMATVGGLLGLVTVASDSASVIAMTAALWLASPVAALVVTVAIVLVAVLLTVFSSRYIKTQTRALTDRIAIVYDQVANLFRGIRELTVLNARPAALRTVTSARVDMTRSNRRLLMMNEVPRLVLDLTLYLAVLGGLLWAIKADRTEEVLPLVALYSVAALRIVPGVARVLGTLTQIRAGVEIGVRLASEFDDPHPHPDAHGHGQTQPYPAGSLVLEDVGFAYAGGDAEQSILSGVNLTIPFGAMVGLVGPSGGGKTTLLSLVLGLLEPTSGTISFGERQIRRSDADWFATVAYVPQDVYVADASVLENVALGADDPDPARVMEALRRAHLGSVIESMEDGLGTRLHEGGVRLSVGQRQRLGIARALYRDAKLLLLDEPTSALDVETERQVVATLTAMKGDLTTIVVAHRLSTLSEADFVVQLKDGVMIDA